MLINRASCVIACFMATLFLAVIHPKPVHANTSYRNIDVDGDILVSAEDPYLWLETILAAGDVATIPIPERGVGSVYEQTLPKELGPLRLRIRGALNIAGGVVLTVPNALELQADTVWIHDEAELRVQGDITVTADEFHGVGRLSTFEPKPQPSPLDSYLFTKRQDDTCKQGTSCATQQDTSGGDGGNGQDGRDGDNGRNGYCEWWGEAEGGNGGGHGSGGSNGGSGQSAGPLP